MTPRLALACAAMLAAPMLAAAATTGVILDEGKPVATVQLSPHAYTPPLAHKQGLRPIVENFANAYPKGLYNGVEGASLSGVHTIHGQVWLAAAFTPKSSATIKEVDVAASLFAGLKNVVAVHIYQDDAGTPGRAVWTQNASLPTFGDCCTIVALPAQIPVEAGKQYWVGLTTVGGPGSTVNAVWNLVVRDQVDGGLTAVNRGQGWLALTTAPSFAFGVYGQ